MQRQHLRVFPLVAAALLALLWTAPTRAAAKPAKASKAAAKANRATSGMKLVVKQGPSCRALAPADWSLVSNAQVSTVELSSPDKSLYAGWGILGVNRAMQPYYGNLYGDPETSIKTLARVLVQGRGDSSTLQYTSAAKTVGYFTFRNVESERTKGLVFYHIYPQPGGNYIESVYFAMTDKKQWQSKGMLAVNVAASIRAVTQLVPSRSSASGRSSGNGSAGKEDPSGPIDRSYNKELGWQRVHSPSTGENFIMTPSDYLETGPDGPGYYRKAGNSYEKLSLGWSAY